MSHDACMCVIDTSTDRARGNIHTHFRSLSLYRQERHTHAHTFSREKGHPFCLSLYRKGGAAFDLSCAVSLRFSCPLCKRKQRHANTHTHCGRKRQTGGGSSQKDWQSDGQTVRQTDRITLGITCEQTHTHTCTRTRTHTYTHTQTLTHTHTHRYTHTHPYSTHAHTRTHTQT